MRVDELSEGEDLTDKNVIFKQHERLQGRRLLRTRVIRRFGVYHAQRHGCAQTTAGCPFQPHSVSGCSSFSQRRGYTLEYGMLGKHCLSWQNKSLGVNRTYLHKSLLSLESESRQRFPHTHQFNQQYT